jgi:hypothetical protein
MDLKPGYERADLLITVKTYPTPSQNHVETVCVAGVRVDKATLSWIRLYPIAFRTLDGEEQFKKYQIVHVPIRARGRSDPRPESYSPDMSQIDMGQIVPSTKNWARRAGLMAPLISATTTCKLIAINRATPMNEPAPSLGLVKPKVSRIEPLDYKGWTPTQLRKSVNAPASLTFSTHHSLNCSQYPTVSEFTTNVQSGMRRTWAGNSRLGTGRVRNYVAAEIRKRNRGESA